MYSPEPTVTSAGRVGSASKREQGLEPHSAPALAEPAPAFTAVKVRDRKFVRPAQLTCALMWPSQEAGP